MPRLSRQERDQAIGRLNAGQSTQTVARAFNVHVTTIRRLRTRFNAFQTTDDRPRSGRPRVTSVRQDRLIYFQHRQERTRSASETARVAIGNHQRPISSDTVRRRLRAENLHCRRPARGPVLTNRHRNNRLIWAQQHRNWRQMEWRRVLFTDECRFCLSRADGRVRIWRRRGERYNDGCVIERDRWGGESIMVWGGMALNHLEGPIIFQNLGPGRGNGVTAQRYIDQILTPYIVPYFNRNPRHLLQQDNARPHIARATVDFLRHHNIATLPWPALSPDLNPIEHLWDELKRRLDRFHPRPTTAANLGQALLRVWQQVPRRTINALVNSMVSRCASVIDSNGGHTRY